MRIPAAWLTGIIIIIKDSKNENGENMGRILSLPKELWDNRALIFKLAKNDFKTKYAGSYLGIIWAFIQPIVTIVMYWLVFEKGLKAGAQISKNGISVPFVLWLSAGLVPWFFFSEALGSGTNALLEYSYLVKKVVFKISILPIIKILSALFVHVFFVAFVLILFACYGRLPDLYVLQVVYYSFCMFILVLALCYTTCSVVVFFRDLSQIINIVLQIGMWATPIMWPFASTVKNESLQFFFKLNPMFYVVNGYRDALIDKRWFFEMPGLTLYFWLVVVFFFLLGTVIFKRLKVHFADVL
jgi:teichoic acid transport system permease protein